MTGPRYTDYDGDRDAYESDLNAFESAESEREPIERDGTDE